MAKMLGTAVAENQNIIQIDENLWEGTKKTVHETLESLACVCEEERHKKGF
jgi:hypothetical protein